MLNKKQQAFINKTDTLLLPLCQNKALPKTLDNLANFWKLPSKQLQASFDASSGKTYTFHTKDKKISLIGCGEFLKFGSLVSIFKKLSFQQHTTWAGEIGIDFSFLEAKSRILEAAVNGLLLGTYQIGLYKTKSKKTSAFDTLNQSLSIYSSLSAKKIKYAVERAVMTTQTQHQIMDLMNAPGNKSTPQVLAAWATQSGKTYGYKVNVLHKKEIEKIGLHALLAVNRGSEYPPEFIIMEYKSKSKKTYPKIGLVGKGVTFDTGGLSIKGAQNMHYMKSDMGGAAAIFGTLELAAKLQLPVHLIGIVPATDNCVDATAVKPGDVIDSYAGKTIEIIDTDAEGRLILADGIAYMQRHFKPDTMIDLATLTGSCVRTLGYHAGGLFTHNDQLATALIEAGQQTGERLWQLPLWDDYMADIQSDVADIKNLAVRPLAGATVAAKFLEFFTDKHSNWAHLDIAGVAFGNSGLSKEKSATAYGIQLLIRYLEML